MADPAYNRRGILSIGILSVIGFLLLKRVDLTEGRKERERAEGAGFL